MNRHRFFHHLTFLIGAFRPLMMFMTIDALNNYFVFFRQSQNHLAAFAFIGASNHFYHISFFYFHLVFLKAIQSLPPMKQPTDILSLIIREESVQRPDQQSVRVLSYLHIPSRFRQNIYKKPSPRHKTFFF